MSEAEQQLARLFRAQSGRLLAALIAQCGDIQLAEDALQDACIQATQAWPKNGVPDNTAGWLLTVARRRLIDKLRQSSHTRNEHVVRQIHLSLTPSDDETESSQEIPDERLKLIFTCCHPAIDQKAQIALTLRTLCGLSTREIARAFLKTESALHQIIVRAKRKIRDAGVAYKVPEDREISSRLEPVLAVIYLIFNESYSAYEGQTLTREELAEEAIRLARVLHKLLPKPAVSGLLALMLFHSARCPARSSNTEAFIPLEKQDRQLWDQRRISQARKILLTAMAQGQAEKYQIQAAISALHSEAKSWQKTDWKQIIALYLALLEREPSPIAELNMLAALSQTGQEQEALRRMLALESQLNNYQPYFAALADTHARLGMIEQAAANYHTAIKMTQNTPERDFLIRKKNQLPPISKLS